MIDPRSFEEDADRAALPPPGAPWPAIKAWCATIAGPEGDPRPIDELAAIARRVEADMGAATVADLLASCYFWQRRLRWHSEGGDAEDALVIRAGLDALRRLGDLGSK